MDSRQSVEAIHNIAGKLGLLDRMTDSIHTLSKGYRQRVGLAQALVHTPKIAVLDEPTSGLDPRQIDEIRDLIRALATNTTVILSTHNLHEVETLCDRVIILVQGAVGAAGTLDELCGDKKHLSDVFRDVHDVKGGRL
jgi:ABC-2 type transport system ATP-binding protein